MEARFQFLCVLPGSVRTIPSYGFVFGIISFGYIYGRRSNGSKDMEVSGLPKLITASFCRIIVSPRHRYLRKIFL